jgi:hypothetical protein
MKKRFSYSIIIPLVTRKKERKKERKKREEFFLRVAPPFLFFSRQNCFFSQCKLFSLFTHRSTLKETQQKRQRTTQRKEQPHSEH